MKRCPYGALVELAFCKKMSTYVTLILDLSIFGASVPDLLIAAQNLQVIGLKITNDELDLSYCYWLVIIGLLVAPIMWFGSPKDMKMIGVTSVSIVFITSALTWTSILSVNSGYSKIPEPSWESVGIAYGILAFQFDVHPMILSVQMDMENKNDVGKAVVYAFLVSGGLFLVTVTLCYYQLGDKVHYNTLQSLPESSLLDMALSLATVQVCLSMAVGSSPFYQDVEHSLGIKPEFGWKRVGFRTFVVLLAVLIGETVPRFDLLMGLVGGAFTGQLVFLFPPLIYSRLRGQLARTALLYDNNVYGTFSSNCDGRMACSDPVFLSASVRTPRKSLVSSLWNWIRLDNVSENKEIGPIEAVWLLAIPAVGFGATVIATYFSFMETLEYSEYAPSCLIDGTAATHLI